ncbi:MAG TPA: DoxX family protein [Parachlamydiaceae bacterium]|nr:DoxX family protein [Parachlamydiaceae bacterium]
MRALRSLLTFIARLCLAGLFIFSGASKLIFFEQTQAFMATKGFTAIPLFLIAAALLELVGGLCLILGYKARFGAAILLLFLIPTTFIFHDFWNVIEPLEQHLQQIMFLKNLAIFGGLLYVFCDGAGAFALDSFSKHSENKHTEQKPNPNP